MRPYTHAGTMADAVIEEDKLVRLANHPTLRGHQARLNGLMGWTSHSTGCRACAARRCCFTACRIA